tara:strand:+ start:499 stop:687 length:189 start_codon:yes stop_codon:yes gene_type:complete
MIISEYMDTKKGKRTAQVRKNASGFYVDLREDNITVKVVELYDKSEQYAEDTAENWVLGILN